MLTENQKEVQKRSSRKYYLSVKQEGLCTGCGGEKKVNSFYCEKCKETQKRYVQSEKGKKVSNKNCRKHYLSMKKQRLCVVCGEKTISSVLCEKCKEFAKRRRQSEEGKKISKNSSKRYAQSKKGKDVAKKTAYKYNHSIEGKKRNKKYSQTKKSKERYKRYNQSDKGKEVSKNCSHKQYLKQKEKFVKNFFPQQELNLENLYFLYILIFSNKDYFKIGRSCNPNYRLNGIERSFKYSIDISILCVVSGTQKNISQLEKYLCIIFEYARCQMIEKVSGKSEFYKIDVLDDVTTYLEDNYKVVYS